MLCPNLRAASAQRYSRAKSAPRVASARLDNRKIAFGGGRLAVHCFSHRSVPLWSRCSPRLHEARWRGTSRRHSAHRLCGRRSPAHPSAQAGAWTGAEYRPRPLRLACTASAQSRRPQRLWPRGRRRRSPPALEALFCTAQAVTLAPTDAENQGRDLRSQDFVRTVITNFSHRTSSNPPIHQSSNPPIHQSSNPPIITNRACI